MRLLFYVPYNRPGGVERVIISLLTEFSKQIDQIILVTSPQLLIRFQGQVPDNGKIIYQPFTLIDYSYKNKFLGLINKLSSLSKQFNLKFFNSWKENYYQNLVFEQIIDKYNITHCLFAIANKTKPPNLKVPLFTISHDIFWHFSPLTYDQKYKSKYDQSLLEWLKKADGIISVSEKTKADIIQLFPNFKNKVKIISNAGFTASEKYLTRDKNKNTEETIFLFPSSFGIYKDHLTVIKAGVILAKERSCNFKIVFIGKETDQILSFKIDLSQQNSTQEYTAYIKQLQNIYRENQNIIEQHFIGLGYCSDQELEQWYQRSDCLIFPSLYEGFGLAISEAIVRGIPVIASDLSVFKEQVNLYKCLDRVSFFERQNEEELVKKMKSLIENPLPTLGKDKIDYYSNLWNWEKVAEKYISVLSSSDNK